MKKQELYEKIGMPDVNAEWERISSLMEAEEVPSAESLPDRHLLPLGRLGGGYKVAAISLGILMLSGLTYAAVRTSFFTQPWDNNPVSVEEELLPLEGSEGRALTLLPSDSIPKPRGYILFKDAELEEILTTICNAYNVEIQFRNEEQKHIRLHFSYNTDEKLAEVIETMNLFEKFKLSLIPRPLPKEKKPQTVGEKDFILLVDEYINKK